MHNNTLINNSGTNGRPSPAAKTVLAGFPGNLCLRPVSNAVRTRATSHPCERGAGLLEILSNPPGNRRRKISVVPFCGTAERRRLAEKNVEVCDVARAQKSF